jgi:hypothetical protein
MTIKRKDVVSHKEKTITAHKILVGKMKVKRQRVRPMNRQGNSIILILKEEDTKFEMVLAVI